MIKLKSDWIATSFKYIKHCYVFDNIEGLSNLFIPNRQLNSRFEIRNKSLKLVTSCWHFRNFNQFKFILHWLGYHHCILRTQIPLVPHWHSSTCRRLPRMDLCANSKIIGRWPDSEHVTSIFQKCLRVSVWCSKSFTKHHIWLIYLD